MATHTTRIIMNGVTGRMGYRQHLVRSILAIRDAASNLGQVDLAACTLYTTLEPCLMCCGAILVSGISMLVVGAVHPSGEGGADAYTAEHLLGAFGWDTANRLVAGVLAAECAAMRQRWGR